MHIEEEDLRALERAVELLAQDTITVTLTQLVGTPIDYLMSKLPKGAEKKIYSLVEKSLNKAANAALWSLDNEPNRIASTGNDSNLLIVFYVQIMPDDFVMQLHR
ncbi:hypothetical protein NP134_24140, partial [Salmonella enterica]|nr:hypothetical protein [Salmonella enterica]